jgi:thiol-disulfide isomerase/thioredoxin
MRRKSTLPSSPWNLQETKTENILDKIFILKCHGNLKRVRNIKWTSWCTACLTITTSSSSSRQIMRSRVPHSRAWAIPIITCFSRLSPLGISKLMPSRMTKGRHHKSNSRVRTWTSRRCSIWHRKTPRNPPLRR